VKFPVSSSSFLFRVWFVFPCFSTQKKSLSQHTHTQGRQKSVELLYPNRTTTLPIYKKNKKKQKKEEEKSQTRVDV
jgi:hypothetical protein